MGYESTKIKTESADNVDNDGYYSSGKCPNQSY